MLMPYDSRFSQQNGFLHAGAALDTACGLAAYTLMPAQADILTVEFKVNMLAPGGGVGGGGAGRDDVRDHDDHVALEQRSI